jgi:hypothetical protein
MEPTGKTIDGVPIEYEPIRLTRTAGMAYNPTGGGAGARSHCRFRNM